MCKHSLHTLLTRLPKCEHHIHLEGALTPSLLFTLAARNGITLPSPTADPAYGSPSTLDARYQSFTSLDDFLHYYFIGMTVLIHESDFEALAWDYFQRAAGAGVTHAEVFFDPQAHTTRGILYSTVVAGFKAACERATRDLHISTCLILCFLRHLPVSSAEQVFTTALPDFENGTLQGIGLDSSEAAFPPQLFESVYAAAESKNINRTAHAGEEGPAEFIGSALSTLHVSRIDHGIRLPSSPELLACVAERQTMLTVCPLSNVRLRCVDNIGDLPIRTFLDRGVKFSINSDDPAYFGGYILENYCAVQEAFDLTLPDWESICRAGIQGSWCGNERKAELLKLLENVLKDWEAANKDR